ncbi:hypothetical protein K1X45_01680 [Pseudochrobactrum sp. Wa41.01b-1]|uniref:hypothetical protein n=1 Tax=Pseudochrobactrum sp. Wa41.01b-1 TaxID=2864102 RepID=UPI001C692D2B|nr:hypothetical protein [Pseudochrobactrum sp. Wa41.01b-1]QYM73187.1 hypothetical protein K1X45_01680 [Pseudochrobactrum sp. Wa41.01b-1]
MNIGTVVFDYDVNTKRLTDALFSEDEIGSIIRCHFEVEQAIEHVLAKFTDGRTKRKANNWNFAQKLELCRIIGIHDNFLVPFKTLNDHRNDFAHNGKITISDKDVTDLIIQVRRACPQFTDQLQLEIIGERKFMKSVMECTNKEKYILAVSMVLSIFCALPHINIKITNSI